MTDNELKEDIISRLYNYKFGQAMRYKKALKKKESIQCLKLLNKIWGDTGWPRTNDKGANPVFDDIIGFLVEFIMLSEGWDIHDL